MENIISINKDNWFLEIDLNGGRIRELKHKDQLTLGTFERIDGKNGNTHICIPNFGNEGMEKYGLQFHGPSRTGLWSVKDINESSLTISYEFENVGSYPGKIYTEQIFNLDGGFNQKVIIKNVGDVDAPINLGIHNYWNSPNGWGGLKINDVDVTKLIKADTYFDVKISNEVSIPGLEKIKLDFDGFDFVRLWSARKEIEGNLMFDNNYVCIEPCIGKDNYFGSEESMLKPGEQRILLQKIKI